MAEYRLSPAAERDLELIWTYTVRQWGVEQADRYLDFLVVAFDKLVDSPKTAPSCEFIRQGYRRWGVGATNDLLSNHRLWNRHRPGIVRTYGCIAPLVI